MNSEAQPTVSCDWSFEQEIFLSERARRREDVEAVGYVPLQRHGSHAGASESEHARAGGWPLSWRSWAAAEGFKETDNVTQTELKGD